MEVEEVNNKLGIEEVEEVNNKLGIDDQEKVNNKLYQTKGRIEVLS